MFKYKMFGKIILALAVCPLSLLAVKHKKFWKIFWAVLIFQYLFVLLFLLYNCLFLGGLKLFYTYDKDEIRVVDDNDFRFHVKGYTKNYTLNSKYYTAHRILLIPESELVPVDYEFNSKIHVEIANNDGQLLHAFTTDKFKKILRDDLNYHFNDYLVYIGTEVKRSSSVFAFELGEIPFELVRLKWSRLKNMNIKITVIEPDEGLTQYCDIASLVVIPDLRL